MDEQIRIPEDERQAASKDTIMREHVFWRNSLRSLHRIEDLLALLIADNAETPSPVVPEEPVRCEATTASGAQCKRAAKPDGALCWAHAKGKPSTRGG